MSLRRRRASRFLAAVLGFLAVVGCDRASDEEPAAPSTTGATTTTAASSTSPPSPATTTTVPTPTTAATPTTGRGPAVVISRGKTSRRTVALTFDAGSDTGHTVAILDTLSGAGIKASFGLTGKWAEENGELVARIARDGHLILNHTYDHRSFTGVSAKPAVSSAADRRDQLARTEAVLTRLTGRPAHPWFRPPYGDYDASVNADVGAAGYAYNVLWTVDSLGWQGLAPAAITTRCLDRAEPGAIYLFHVGAASQDATALPGIIRGLRDGGYSFGTVAEVIAD